MEKRRDSEDRSRFIEVNGSAAFHDPESIRDHPVAAIHELPYMSKGGEACLACRVVVDFNNTTKIIK